MDPLSVSASIIAVLGLAGNIGLKIKRIVKDFKNVPPELAEVRDEVKSLSWMLKRVEALAEEERQANSGEPDFGPVKLYAAGRKTTDIEIALRSCMTVMKEMNRRLDVVQSCLHGGPFDKMKYSLSLSTERDELRDLRCRLERGKTAILMSLQFRILGLAKVASSASTDQHMAIRELLKLVRELKQQNCESTPTNRTESEPIRTTSTTEAMSTTPFISTMSDLESRDDTANGHDGRERQFVLQIYSNPLEWLANFRTSTSRNE